MWLFKVAPDNYNQAEGHYNGTAVKCSLPQEWTIVAIFQSMHKHWEATDFETVPPLSN